MMVDEGSCVVCGGFTVDVWRLLTPPRETVFCCRRHLLRSDLRHEGVSQ